MRAQAVNATRMTDGKLSSCHRHATETGLIIQLMKHSTDRILTTHAGRLDGPRDLRDMTFSYMSGRGPDLAALTARVQSGITETIRKQADAGIDIISDGELGKIGFGFAYYGRRLSGLATRKVNPGEIGLDGRPHQASAPSSPSFTRT